MNQCSPRRAAAVLALLATLLAVAACGGPATAVPAGDAARGASLWAASPCTGCHGVDGLGARGGPALIDTPLTLRDVTGIVRRGGPGMPGYPPEAISDQDIRDMLAWFLNPAPVSQEADPWLAAGCAGCHGASAEGGIGPRLAGTAQPFAEFQAVVRRGVGSMPGFPASQVSDQALQAMHAWLQGGAAAPAPQATPAQAAAPTQAANPWAGLPCAGCHGASAEGGTGPRLAGTGLALSDFQAIVRQGVGSMPGFPAGQVSDQALQALHSWLQGGAAAPAPPTAPVPQAEPWIAAGCAGCHGVNAEGGSAERLAGEGIRFDKFQRAVREGEEGMPAYTTGQVSDADLQRMYDWLMALP